jgi:hypothetical protein
MSPDPTTSDGVFAALAIVLGLAMGIAPRATLHLIFRSHAKAVPDERIKMLQGIGLLMALSTLAMVAGFFL